MIRITLISLLLFSFLAVVAQEMPGNLLLSSSSNEANKTSNHRKSDLSYSEVDVLATSIKSKHFSNYTDLSKYLTGRCANQRGKIRSIYTWIASNIRYTKPANLSINRAPDQSVAAVWATQNAVCEGFANLFVAMCDASGIESRMIKGYVRDYTGHDLNFPNHAWNSVKIDGRWHLLDVTWASVNTRSDILGTEELSEMYRKHKLDYYFLVKPKKMILTHLPEDPYWQLQNKMVTLEAFAKGEEAVNSMLQTDNHTSSLNFEAMISSYENLDSLDRSIAYLDRMVTGKNNKVREYGLGIAYYYKAQSILKEADKKNIYAFQKAKDEAKSYYEKSLEYLLQLEEDDFGYDFSKDLATNVSFRMEVLQ